MVGRQRLLRTSSSGAIELTKSRSQSSPNNKQHDSGSSLPLPYSLVLQFLNDWIPQQFFIWTLSHRCLTIATNIKNQGMSNDDEDLCKWSSNIVPIASNISNQELITPKLNGFST